MELSVLANPVRVHLRSAPDPTITLYLQRAARQFCHDSQAWIINVGMKSVSPAPTGQELKVAVPSTGMDTDFVLPTESALNRIAEVRLDDNKLDDHGYRYDRPTAQIVLQPGVVMQAGALHVDAVLEPSLNAQNIPDFLGEQWGEGIADYAIYEMMMMPGQDWSNPVLAGAYRRKYHEMVSEATVDLARGGTRRGIRLAPIPFV